MVLRQCMNNKWAIETENGFVLCERNWHSQREAEEWIRIYLTSWPQHLNYRVELLPLEKPKRKIESNTTIEAIKVEEKEVELPPIPLVHSEAK